LEHLRNIGEKTPYGYLERRVEELRENLMEQNVVNRIYQRSTEGVLMSDPYGRAGVFYRWLQKTLGESRLQSQMTDSKMTALAKLLGRSVFLIMRVPANFLNM